MAEEPRTTLTDGRQVYPEHRKKIADGPRAGQQQDYVVLAEEERGGAGRPGAPVRQREAGRRGVIFSRAFSMPSADTFSMPPVEAFVRRYLAGSKCSVDPFARNKRWATVTNDLSPDTAAEFHMDAEAFLRRMADEGRRFDLALFDPPYSPRQISECYKGIGLEVGMKETQNAALYKRVRDALAQVLTPDATVLSFGWNSNGMGKGRGWEIVETMLVAHGGGHNDTICIAEKRVVRRDLFSAMEAA